jgi:hypothetical protein
VELGEDNSLSLDFANLFCNDPLSHFLKHDETLLYDFNGLSVANNLAILNDGLIEHGVVEVADAIEIVKVVKGGETTPPVEGVVSSSSESRTGLSSQRRRSRAHSKDSDGDELNSEHVVIEW